MQGGEASAAVVQTSEQKLVLAHKVLRETKGLQFDFAAAPLDRPPAWLAPLLEFLKLIAPALVYVFWGGVIVGAALILYFILREVVPERWFRRTIDITATDWRPAPEAARELLTEADALAGSGRFEEAIHLLLFRSIDDLAGRRPGAVKPALTSRDIAGLDVLPGDARAAFGRLAQSVERTFFGGRPAGAEAFEAARSDYKAFALAEGWR